MRTMNALVLAVALLAASMPAAAAQQALALPEAIRAALEDNPAHRILRLEVGKAEENRQAAVGARYPSLDFLASATRYGYPTPVTGIRQIGVFPPLDETIYDYGVALKLPLYTGGKLTQGVTFANLGKEISLERERLGSHELTYNVSAVYMKILHLTALDEAYGARIASLEAQEQRVKLLVEVGRAPRLDLLRIGVLLAKARHDRLQVRHRRKEAYALLYNLMGMEGRTDETPLVGYAAAAVPAWSLETLRHEALAQRPEMKIAERETAAARAQEQIARGERLPSLSLVGAYHDRRGADTGTFDDWNVGVVFSVPLLDGGVRRARAGEAALARQQAELALTETRLAVDRQMQDAWNAHQESQSRVRVTETSVAEAAEALAIEKLRFEQGVGTVTDLLAAESALLTAQADRLQAEFDLVVARLDVLRATGVLSPERAAALVTPQPNPATEHPRP